MEVRFHRQRQHHRARPPTSRKLYVDALGLPLERLGGDYFATNPVPQTDPHPDPRHGDISG
ncbi:MAG TPA: hypothetical protein VF003_00375 [Pseudonocardiaceae bacterium]